MTSATRLADGRQFVELDGLRIRVFVHDDRREEREPAILFVHGAGGNYLQWPPALRRMPGALTIAPDLPGHGESSDECFSDIDGYAKFIGELIDAIGLQQVVVIGYSMGAAIALQYAHQAVDRVAGIGILAGGMQLPVPPDLPAQIRSDFDAATQRIVEASFGPHTPSSTRDLYCKRLRQTDPETLVADFVASSAFDARSYVGSLVIPALIVAGELDNMVPPSSSRALHKRMLDSELYILDGAGHLLLWECTGQLVRLISDLAEHTKHR